MTHLFNNKKLMSYWLTKSEPETFSWDHLEHKGTSMWDGVRNFQARNNLRKMKKGDTVFFYHSGKNSGIVGLAEVIKEYYPDPTAKEGDWSVVDVKPLRKLKRFITLQEIKQIPELKNMYLVRSPRLSVQPVKPEEFNAILELEKKNK
jgi:predicted RNA-binding protein with PUA-like domain